ncbi:hypothetical protein COO60DRAFT_446713 [Scenedesmus sp. NREL 46B-D3]|nr:hypothetical protein COO60DRAFT_446713 [Scenedesmus sp. NREL 46B-D3]
MPMDSRLCLCALSALGCCAGADVSACAVPAASIDASCTNLVSAPMFLHGGAPRASAVHFPWHGWHAVHDHRFGRYHMWYRAIHVYKAFVCIAAFVHSCFVVCSA